MKHYSGYRSWNGWNVSLWINNEEPIYRYALVLLATYKLNFAVKKFMQDYKTTPDGAKYNRISVYDCFKDLKENN